MLIPQYGGTVGGFRKELLDKVGGWDPAMLAEDTDLTVRSILNGYQVRYVNDAECYEEAVTTWKAYWRQRYRWAKGHMQCAFKHLKSVFKSRHLSPYEKIELTLLLCIYFMPILVLAGWIVGVLAYLYELKVTTPYILLLTTITYSTVGSFAPFFEVGTAAYLDRRRRILWLLPFLTFAFFLMAFCCTKALIDLLLTRDGNHRWTHTLHNGNGYRNGYFNGNGSHNGGRRNRKSRGARLL